MNEIKIKLCFIFIMLIPYFSCTCPSRSNLFEYPLSTLKNKTSKIFAAPLSSCLHILPARGQRPPIHQFRFSPIYHVSQPSSPKSPVSYTHGAGRKQARRWRLKARKKGPGRCRAGIEYAKRTTCQEFFASGF